MWLFSGIKNKYEKIEASAVVHGLLNFESLHLANKLVEFVWDSEPDIFNGKFGQRPHKMTVAAYALAIGVEIGVDLFAIDKQNQKAIVVALSTILFEIQTNGTLYPLNSLDHQLLKTSMAIFLEFSQELDKSPLGKEIITDQLAECRKAAEQGNVDAQCNLGVMYAEGISIAKNEAQAVVWYRKAAEQGDATAQYHLAHAYEQGKGVAKNVEQAVVWFRKAAERGFAAAQYNLGVMYAEGIGIAKNEAQAVMWYRKAAEQGHADAQNNLGMMYADGRGVAENEAQAVVWYRKAAEQGDAIAQYHLARAYAQGKGVTQNLELAVIWCRKASEQELEEPNKTTVSNMLVLFERLKNEIS
jgi:TPR repeat protein